MERGFLVLNHGIASLRNKKKLRKRRCYTSSDGFQTIDFESSCIPHLQRISKESITCNLELKQMEICQSHTWESWWLGKNESSLALGWNSFLQRGHFEFEDSRIAKMQDSQKECPQSGVNRGYLKTSLQTKMSIIRYSKDVIPAHIAQSAISGSRSSSAICLSISSSSSAKSSRS